MCVCVHTGELPFHPRRHTSMVALQHDGTRADISMNFSGFQVVKPEAKLKV